jgi:adenylate cyclase
VARLSNSLGVELVKAEALRAIRERPSNPNAADLAMQADAKSSLPATKANLNDAAALSERALALDVQNVDALTVLANALVNRVLDRWSDNPAGDIARAEKMADAALALQPENSWAHYAKGQIYFAERQLGQSNTEFETAIAQDSNNANAHAFIGFLKVFFGRAEDGFAEVETAFRLSPRDPGAPWWQFYMCVFHNHLEQWEQAIPRCEKSIAGIPQVFYPYVELAAAYAWAGHEKEAKETVAQLQKVQPGYTVQTWAGRHMSENPTYKAQYQRIVEGLRKAGLPEGDKTPN